MRVLVIGGAGYIGSHVTRALLDRGDSVTVYDNLSTGCRQNLFKDVSFIKDDILNYSGLTRVMKKGFDALVHLAAFKAAGESMQKPEKYSVNNISGTINILNAACETGIKNFVFSSSAAVYGEPEYLPIDEKHPTKPENYYGYTKLTIEGFLNWYDKLKNIRFAALRYFNAAGYDPEGRIKGLEKNSANLLPVIMDVAIGKRKELLVFGDDYETKDGTGVRDYVHVTDLARAHLSAMDLLAKKGESFIVNLGSDTGVSVNEMLTAARKITGKPVPSRVVDRRPGDPAKLCATSKKALALLKWKPEYSDVQTMVRTAWNVYKAHSK
ncbi:MAG: UDP-glucose 4-epimerase GalE [Spirochaetales bacterium]|nr:UDP-glucose 4-epimerase GalE [Spirochaetales bacterium]